MLRSLSWGNVPLLLHQKQPPGLVFLQRWSKHTPRYLLLLPAFPGKGEPWDQHHPPSGCSLSFAQHFEHFHVQGGSQAVLAPAARWLLLQQSWERWSSASHPSRARSAPAPSVPCYSSLLSPQKSPAGLQDALGQRQMWCK